MPQHVPAQNRVTPWGDVVSCDVRGAWMGNRGRLHEGAGSRIVVRTQQTKAWITCVLSFKEWKAAQWHPHHYTPLFFLDEAVSLAAGHRPCAECRRADFLEYQRLWAEATGSPALRAAELDRVLQGERRPVGAGGRRTRAMPWRELPDGAFVLIDTDPAVVVEDHVAMWDARSGRYGQWRTRPTARDAQVLTPPSTVGVLRAGYTAQIDAAADGLSAIR